MTSDRTVRLAACPLCGSEATAAKIAVGWLIEAHRTVDDDGHQTMCRGTVVTHPKFTDRHRQRQG